VSEEFLKEEFLKKDGRVVDNPRQFWQVTTHAEHYDRGRFGDHWGRLYRVAEEHAIRRALRSVGRNRRVLDVACGTGRVTALLVREGFAEVVGSDVSSAMMEVAKRRLPHVEFFQSDAARLPFDNDSFDVVTCIGLLMHLDASTRVTVLKELARISRRPVIVQYGCVGGFLRFTNWITGKPAGGVRYPVTELEMRQDLQHSGLLECERFWALRPLSSSLILSLAK
jgi:SAM-dependent methyltransferase